MKIYREFDLNRILMIFYKKIFLIKINIEYYNQDLFFDRLLVNI